MIQLQEQAKRDSLAAEKRRRDKEMQDRLLAEELARKEAMEKAKREKEANDAALRAKRDAEEKARLEAIAKAKEEEANRLKKKQSDDALAEQQAREQAEREKLEKARLEEEKLAKERLAASELQRGGKTLDSSKVVLVIYDAARLGYKVKYYGYINFGDGTGNKELTKEQFMEYSKKFKVKNP
jgi:hypothetical protein